MLGAEVDEVGCEKAPWLSFCRRSNSACCSAGRRGGDGPGEKWDSGDPESEERVVVVEIGRVLAYVPRRQGAEASTVRKVLSMGEIGVSGSGLGYANGGRGEGDGKAYTTT